MSEYQYYEFRAVDRPLTEQEMAELRGLSTRAEITPTSFQNEYNYGDFRGDPTVLMQKYFDAFVYVANWGTHRFMLRLPAALLSPDVAHRYEIEPGMEVLSDGDKVILEFSMQDEAPEWVEGDGWLASLLPLRDNLARGDLRALYLGWLSGTWEGELDGDEVEDEEDLDWREPPVPPGLHELSTPLRALIDFLQIDPDLVAVAAQSSAPMRASEELRPAQEAWLRRLPDADKNALLLQVMQGEGMAARAQLVQRFRQDTAPSPTLARRGGRTMGELMAAAREYGEKRKEREREQAARERKRRAQEAAAAREKYLQRLVGREDTTWQEIETLLEARRGPQYEQAARYVVDLRDVAQRQGTMPDFRTRLRHLRERHAGKPAFIRRLDAAKLP